MILIKNGLCRNVRYTRYNVKLMYPKEVADYCCGLNGPQ